MLLCSLHTQSGGAKATGTVDSMLNDDCKKGGVTLRGTVNGQPFEVEREVKVSVCRHTSHLYTQVCAKSVGAYVCVMLTGDGEWPAFSG